MPETTQNPAEPLTNHRQELFCQYLAAGESKTQAYLKANYKQTIHAQTNCYRLSQRDEVRRRITYLQEQIKAKVVEKATNVTKDSITQDFRNAIKKAEDQGATASVIAGLGWIAKIHGFGTDKGTDAAGPPQMTPEQQEYAKGYAAYLLEQQALKARENIRRIG